MLIVEIFTLIFLIPIILREIWVLCALICIHGMVAVKTFFIVLLMMGILYWPVSILVLLCLLYQVYFIINYKKGKEKYKNEKSSENELE